MTMSSTIGRKPALLFAGLLLAGCGDEGDGGGPASAAQDAGTEDQDADGGGTGADGGGSAPRPIRFVHFSDTHLMGGPDSHAARRLAAAVEAVNGFETQPDLVLVTGDLVDYVTAEQVRTGADGPLHLLRELLDGLETTWRAVAGNHEYYVADDPYELTPERDTVDAYLEALLGQPPYHSLTVGGVRIVLLNSMHGPLWNLSEGLSGSFSDEQLAWLREELSEGLPTLLFMHHPPDTALVTEGGDSLAAVVADHPGTVKGIFSGHIHRYLSGEFEGLPSYTVGSLRDGEAVWFYVEYDPGTDELVLLNGDQLDFDQLVTYACEPGVLPPAGRPGGLVGPLHRLELSSPETDASGLAAYAGEALKSLPLFLVFDRHAPLAGELEGRITMSKPAIRGPWYYDYLDGAPCEPVRATLENPCLQTEPVGLEFDLLRLAYLTTEAPLDESWRVRLAVDDLWLQAVVVDRPEGPVLTEGLLHATLDGRQGHDDLCLILVDEYCAGHIEGCEPGSSDELPPCPAERSADLVDAIPLRCDVAAAGFTVRTALALVGSVAEEPVHLDANLRGVVTDVSEEEGTGTAHPDLFSDAAGRNCE